MTETIVAIGTRKGLWLARSADRQQWSLEGPHVLMREVAAVAIDTRQGPPIGARRGEVVALGPDRAGERGWAGNSSRRTTRGFYRSGDGGQTWDSIAAGLPTDFGFTILTHPRRPGVVWNVPVQDDGERIPPGARLQVQHSEDSGKTWRELSEGLPSESYTCVLRDAAALDDSDGVGLYLGTRNEDVFASVDEGESFSRSATQLPDVLAVRAAQLE